MTEANPFWEFSLALYSRPGIADACLKLQDEHSVDVNLLLYCAWRCSVGAPLDAEGVSAVDAGIREWRAEVVQPLRTLRRKLKSVSGSDSTRDLVKQAELDAERVQQLEMFKLDIPASAIVTAEKREPEMAPLAAFLRLPEEVFEEFCQAAALGLRNRTD